MIAEGDESKAQVVGVGEVSFLPEVDRDLRDLIASRVDVRLLTSGCVLNKQYIANRRLAAVVQDETNSFTS